MKYCGADDGGWTEHHLGKVTKVARPTSTFMSLWSGGCAPTYERSAAPSAESVPLVRHVVGATLIRSWWTENACPPGGHDGLDPSGLGEWVHRDAVL
jgi:hypothetical protein